MKSHVHKSQALHSSLTSTRSTSVVLGFAATLAHSGLGWAQAEVRCPSDWITSIEVPTVASTQFHLRCDSYTTLPEGRMTFGIHSVDSRINSAEFAGFVTQGTALGAATEMRLPNGGPAVRVVDGVRTHAGRHGLGDTVPENVRIAIATAGNQAMLVEGSVFGAGEVSMRTRVLNFIQASVGLSAAATPWIATATCPAGMQPDTTTRDFALGPHPMVHCSTPDQLLMLQVHESRVRADTAVLAGQEAMVAAQLLDVRGWVVPAEWEARKREWARIGRSTREFVEGTVRGFVSVREGRMEIAGRPRHRQGTVHWITLPQYNGHHVQIALLAFDQRRSGRLRETLQQFVRDNLRVSTGGAPANSAATSPVAPTVSTPTATR